MNREIELLNEKILKLNNRIKKLKQIAYHDYLTGVYNRNWFFKKIKYDNTPNVTIVDINRLKLINDQQGHKAGDKMIIKVATFLQSFGEVIRYGGDEFIVITDDDKKFQDLNHYKTDEFCAGGSMAGECKNIAGAIDLADQRLYECKKKRK